MNVILLINGCLVAGSIVIGFTLGCTFDLSQPTKLALAVGGLVAIAYGMHIQKTFHSHLQKKWEHACETILYLNNPELTIAQIRSQCGEFLEMHADEAKQLMEESQQ